ncbi:hypothetical protein CRUP_026598 [Coryphaenoides rupestris]|nr:hypothetical protein CRUP_026598 [Coryphaenoides rupestris]
MDDFLSTAQKQHATEDNRLDTAQKRFQEMVSYFGLRPKSGEKDVAPGFVFMLWYEFCCDFKNTWKRENKNISKERLGTKFTTLPLTRGGVSGWHPTEGRRALLAAACLYYPRDRRRPPEVTGLKEAQENIKKITAEKRVETKKINANSLKERLRQKQTSSC